MKNFKIFYLLFIGITALSVQSYAQQFPMYNQYVFNAYTINPAESGTRNYGTASFLHRFQWLGVNGAPTTSSFGLETNLGSSFGLGLNFIADQIGSQSIQTMNIATGYHLKLTDKIRLATGLSFVANNETTNLANLQNMYDPDDPDLQKVSSFSPNVGGGLLLYTEKLFIGIAVPRTIEYKASNSNNFALDQVRHAFIYAGRAFYVTEQFQFRPSVLLKVVSGAPAQMDFNAVLSYHRMIDLGINYRSGDSAGLMAGITVKERLTFNYVYELPLSAFRFSTVQTHEVGIRYRFGQSHFQSIQSPRFFN
ncbi:MAG: PorP/SprF family type IX secretion system membrane protein [Bacteroidetes bacterium]|nr:PorP/SprF family type IX secretion system membrane protein [Bacteroidota bacterium]